MAVLQRYTCSLRYAVEADGYEDENGDYHPGGSHYEGNLPCDVVPSGNASERSFEDGVIRSYSYTVHLKANAPSFTIGDRVEVSMLDDVKQFTVKGFQRNQLSCIIWV